jgi:hypothetical protein
LHLLKPGQPAALILGALLTIAVATVAGGHLAASVRNPGATSQSAD